jgi:hypothetical protein
MFLEALLKVKNKEFYIDYESLANVTNHDFIEKVKLGFLDHGLVVELRHARDKHQKIIYAKSCKGIWFSFATGQRDSKPLVWFSEKMPEGWFPIIGYLSEKKVAKQKSKKGGIH